MFNWPKKRDPNEKREFVATSPDGTTKAAEVPILDTAGQVIGLTSSPAEAQSMGRAALEEHREAA